MLMKDRVESYGATGMGEPCLNINKLQVEAMSMGIDRN